MEGTPVFKSKIAIVGAGVAGSVFALTILSHPTLSSLYEPILLDKLPSPLSITVSSSERGSQNKASYAAGAAVALTSNALFPLYSLGLRESLDTISCETTEIKLWRTWKDGTHQYYNKILNPNWQSDLETNLRIVERKDLQALLISKIQELGGQIRWGWKLSAIHHLKNGKLELSFGSREGIESHEVSLLVGADGAWSSVRKHIVSQAYPLIWEEKWNPKFAGADVIYGISHPVSSPVNLETPKDGDTHALLLNNGIASTWSLPGGRQFWALSIASPSAPHQSSHRTSSAAQEIDLQEDGTETHALEPTEDMLKRHKNVFHPTAGTFGEIVRSSERIVRTPLYYRAWDKEEISSKNCLCIGDAGRLMLPSSGQGACFAIEDATVLANALLNNAPTNGDFKTAIGEYMIERAPRSKRMMGQSYWTGLVSLGEKWWWRWVRDWASKWMPMGGDPKLNQNAAKRDPMGWLYNERFKVEVRGIERE